MWFKKKGRLIDVLHGTIDIHSHILPNIDDGSTSIEMSLNMLELYAQLGFKKIIATPHVMIDYYGNNKQIIQDCFHDFKEQIRDTAHSHILHRAAAEYMLDDGFEKHVEKQELQFLNSGFLLVEFSYFQMPQNTHELVFQLRQQDINPILAHPERYRYIKKTEDYENLKDMGFDFQLNILSLLGHYGKDAFAKAKTLLHKGLYDYLGTDAHKPQHLEKLLDEKLDIDTLKKVQELANNNLQLCADC